MKIEEQLAVTGMTCSACANAVGKMLSAVDPSVEANVNYATDSANITFDPAAVTLEQLAKSLDKTSYRLILSSGKNYDKYVREERDKEYERSTRNLKFAGILTVPVVAISMIPSLSIPFENEILMLLTAFIVFFLGKKFFLNAYHILKVPSANMDTLVALSTSVAFIHSALVTLIPVYSSYFNTGGMQAHVYFESAAVIVTFILLGKWLEERAKRRSSESLQKLIESQPDTVNVVRDNGKIETVSLSEIIVGDVVQIKPGDRIPLDGVVVSGQTTVDQSLITGEPVPEMKQEGDLLFAGTVNQDGLVEFKSTSTGATTKLSQIVELVKRSQDSKAPIQSLVDKIAAVFVPVVVSIAIIAGVVWLLSDNPDKLAVGLNAFISVLVIACPCALGLATPMAIMVSMGKAADLGIVVRDAEHLQKLQEVTTLVFDKTGTLTMGKPQVKEIKWTNGVDEKENISIIASVVRTSTHPLSKAMVDHFSAAGQLEVSEVQNEPGKGIRAKVGGKTVMVGSRNFIHSQGVEAPVSNDQYSEVLVAIDNNFIARILIEDPIRPEAQQAIHSLQNRGLKTVLLTGDRKLAGETVAKQLGIDQVYAELLPNDKVDHIKKLQQTGEKVAMLGDGINDAASISASDVGIAVASGAEIANEAAGINLMNDDLLTLPRTFNLAAKTTRIIKQNLFWAFIYNVIGIPIAAGILFPAFGIWIDPMYAGIAMAFSSLSVVGNSLRLKIVKT